MDRISALLIPHLFLAGIASPPQAPAGVTPPHPRAERADSLRAGPPAPWPVPTDTTYVIGRRLTRSERLRQSSSFASVIHVTTERGPAEEAADLLERTVGLSVQRYGGPGAMATLSIRGADPGEVEVFLDQIPLRSAARGPVDLSALDLAQIETVEVYRSAPPADLGGEAAGAAVRLVTRTGGPRQVAIRSCAGSFGTCTLEGLASGALGGGRFLLSASRFQTDGDYAYFNDNGTTHDTTDDRWQAWTNGDVRRASLLARLTHRLGTPLTIDWTSQLWTADQGLPGTNQSPTQASRLETDGLLHRAELTAKIRRRGPLELRLFGFRGNEGRRYRDPLRELAVPGTAAGEIHQDHRRSGAGLRLGWTLWPVGTPAIGAHRFEALLETRRETLRKEPAPERPAEDLRRRTSGVLTVGDCVELLGGRLRADLHYRWDRSTNNYEGADPYRPFAAHPDRTFSYRGPHLGLRLTLPGGHILKANYAHQARFPTFSELFGYAGVVHGNPELQPETGRRADLGWVWELPAHPWGMAIRSEQVLYTQDREQMLVLIRVSNRETKPFNLDQAHIHGSESSLSIDHLPLLRDLAPWGICENAVRRLLGLSAGSGTVADARFSGHLEWQATRDEGASPIYHGEELTYHPALRAGLNLEWLQDRWRFSYHARYRAASFWSRLNLPAYRSPPQWDHELSIRWQVRRPGVTLALRVDNLAGSELEDMRGYPLPGRAWYGGLELDFLGRTPHP